MSAARSFALLAGFTLALHALVAFGEAYPTKVIRLIVGYPPGAQSDTSARLVALGLGHVLGQTVVVENRSGATATIAAEVVARSSADGYTLLLGVSTNLALAPLLFSDLRYDPVRDFVPIGRIAQVPWMIAVRATLPVVTLANLLDYARAHPGELTFAGSAGGTQLAAMMLAKAARIEIVQVPYKGTTPAVADVAGGRVDFTIADLSALAPHMQSGKLRLLATTGPQRLPSVPDVPTVSEQGFPGFSTYSWNALVAPRDTPAEVVATLRRALRLAMHEPELRDGLERMGFVLLDEDPEEFAGVLKGEIERFRLLVRESGIRIEIK